MVRPTVVLFLALAGVALQASVPRKSGKPPEMPASIRTIAIVTDATVDASTRHGLEALE